MGILQRLLRTQHLTGTAAARESALSSHTPAPPGTRSTPSAGLMETGAQAQSLNVEIRELHLVQVLQPRNLGRSQARNQERNQERSQERNQGRNQGRSPLRENQERNQGRSLGRSQERNQERNPERSQERSQEKERNQTKAEQCLLLNVIMWMQTICFHWPNNKLSAKKKS